MKLFLPPAILLARKIFYEQADSTPEARDYVKAHHLDLDAINAHTGLFAVCLCQTDGRYFDFDPEGAVCAVIEVLAEDAETVVDLCAWPLYAPERFTTSCDEADILGINGLCNPATYAGGRPLKVHRTPLGWLQAGCTGCVVLNSSWGGYWLSRCAGPIVAEDLAHGRELRRMLPKTFDMRRLLVPVDTEWAAA